MPKVAKRTEKRVTMVIADNPAHVHWAKHSELVRAAMVAVRAVGADRSVGAEQVRMSLDRIRRYLKELEVICTKP